MTRPAHRPTGRPAPSAGADRPTAAFPTHPLATAYPLPEGWRIDPAGYLPLPSADGGAAAARLEEADATPTQTFPTEETTRAALFPEVGPLCGRPADAASIARAGAHARTRVYHTPSTRGRRPALSRRERLARADRRRQALRRHLRAALAAIALAAALLTGMQLYAAAGITQARQAALAARDEGAATAAASAATPASYETEPKHARNNQAAPASRTEGASPTPPASPAAAPSSTMSGQTAAWVTQDTGAPYSKDDAAATPLDLPRCTTAPDTPMPCLAHLHTSPSGAPDRVVTLEEDGSLTAFVPR